MEGSQGIEHLACLAPLSASCHRLQGGDGDGDGSEEEEEEEDVCGDGHQHRSPPSHIILLSLFMEFTVSETLAYFGRLLSMTKETVNRRRCETN